MMRIDMRAVDSLDRLLVVVLLLALVPAASGEEDRPAKPAQEAIDRAIERGAACLEKMQEADGSWERDVGKTGLALLTLAHAGRDPRGKRMSRGVNWLVSHLVRPDTYATSLAIMVLATVDPAGQKKRIERYARMLAAGQCRNGQWSYALKGGRSGGDNSNTQFAVLGLWCATRAGVEVDAAVFERCRSFFTGTQNEDGGWGYSAKERRKSYGSMTATGLAALVVCRSGAEAVRLSDERVRRGPEAAKAVAWLERNLALDRNPEANFKMGRTAQGNARKTVRDSFWKFYWLWSLERAATLVDLDRLENRDWYGEGARHLTDTQRDDGSWVGSESAMLATCFAVLFLSRSTRRIVITEPALPRGPVTPK